MAEDVYGAVKDILKSVCAFRGVSIDEHSIESKVQPELDNETMLSFRFTLLYRILSIGSLPEEYFVRCYYESDPYPSGSYDYVVCDDPPDSKETEKLTFDIFNDVKRLLLLQAYSLYLI